MLTLPSMFISMLAKTACVGSGSCPFHACGPYRMRGSPSGSGSGRRWRWELQSISRRSHEIGLRRPVVAHRRTVPAVPMPGAGPGRQSGREVSKAGTSSIVTLRRRYRPPPARPTCSGETRRQAVARPHPAAPRWKLSAARRQIMNPLRRCWYRSATAASGQCAAEGRWGKMLIPLRLPREVVSSMNSPAGSEYHHWLGQQMAISPYSPHPTITSNGIRRLRGRRLWASGGRQRLINSGSVMAMTHHTSVCDHTNPGSA